MLQQVADYSQRRPEDWNRAFTAGAEKRHALEMLPGQRKLEKAQQEHVLGMQPGQHELEAFQQKNALRKAKRLDEYNSKVDAYYSKEGHNPWDLVKINKDYKDVASQAMGDDGFEGMPEQDRQMFTKSIGPIYHAARNGSYEIAARKAREYAGAIAKVDPEGSALANEFAERISSDDPNKVNHALDDVSWMLFNAMGADNFEKMLKSSGTQAESEGKQLALSDAKMKRANKANFNFLATQRKLIERDPKKSFDQVADNLDKQIAKLEKSDDPLDQAQLERLRQVEAALDSENLGGIKGTLEAGLADLDQESYSQMVENEQSQAVARDLREREITKREGQAIREKELDAELEKIKLDQKVFERENIEGPKKMALEKRKVKVQEAKIELEIAKAKGDNYKYWAVDQREAVNAAAKEAEQNAKKVSKASLLLHDVGLLENSAGQISVWGDKFDLFIGNETTRAEYRTKITNFVNKDLLQDLPPGVASDADMIRAEKGYPPEGSHPDAYKRYFQDVVKAAKKAQSYHTAKVSYLSSNQGVDGDNKSGEPITLQLDDGRELVIPVGSNLGKEWENMFGYVEPPEYMNPTQKDLWEGLTRPEKELLLSKMRGK